MPTEAHLQSLASLQISSPALLKPHDPHPSGQQQQQQEYSEAREAPVAQAKPQGCPCLCYVSPHNGPDHGSRALPLSAAGSPGCQFKRGSIRCPHHWRWLLWGWLRGRCTDQVRLHRAGCHVQYLGHHQCPAPCRVEPLPPFALRLPTTAEDQLGLVWNLRTAMIEREDFASGTSSKSTKLVHGGVRYLEKPCYSWWEVIYYGVGLKILYYDGQFNDTRLNVTLATSAAAAGAAVSNYTDCVGLIKVGCLHGLALVGTAGRSH
eukprot:451797-Pelagomonas_calceolata.AAC.2